MKPKPRFVITSELFVWMTGLLIHLLPSNHFPMLSHDEVNKLCSPYLECAVKMTIFYTGAYKAPGLDGCQTLFYQTIWEVPGESLTSLTFKMSNG